MVIMMCKIHLPGQGGGHDNDDDGGDHDDDVMFFAGDLQSSSAWTPSFSSGDQSEAASYL